MPTTEAFALFSTSAYEEPWNSQLKHDIPDSWRRLPINPRFLDDPVTGFRAHVYHNYGLKEVVIAYAGTDLGDRGDLKALKDIINRRLPQQFDIAFTAHTRVKEYMDQERIRALISFTGHSLGGALAQYMAIAKKGCPAETFGAPGILNALGKLQDYYDASYPYPVVNHIARDDTIGHYGWHLGRKKYYFFGATDSPLPMTLPSRMYQGHSIERYLREYQHRAGSIKHSGKCTYKNCKKYEIFNQLNWSGVAKDEYI